MILHNSNDNIRCSLRVFFLAFLWIASFAFGSAAANKDKTLILLMRIAPTCDVSIAGLIAVLIIPFMLTIFGLSKHRPVIIYLVIAVRAFVSGYLFFGMLNCYGCSSWLVYTLMLFSNSAMSTMLLWLIFQHITPKKKRLGFDVFVIALLTAVVGVIDYFVISPFLVAISATI